MVTKILVTVVLVTTMVQAGPAREPRWGKHGDYKDGEWEKKYEAPDYSVEKVGWVMRRESTPLPPGLAPT